MNSSPNILVCPLDWGIGHATRCVPIIRELMRQKANVIIGADGHSLEFLKIAFPGLQLIKFPGYRFSYPRSGKMSLKMLIQARQIMEGIRAEGEFLRQIVRNHKIDGVISDNRYGLFSSKVPAVFLTHQLKIQVPVSLFFLENLLYRINRNYISKYSECWVPDFPDEPNLSGRLSHPENFPYAIHYIHPLSRFTGLPDLGYSARCQQEQVNDFFVILSGPEPQRTLLEDKILSQLRKRAYTAIVVRGLPGTERKYIDEGNIKIYNHLNTENFAGSILGSRYILSRPGYSTLMDLSVFGRKAIFIPTPGQTEQEYLARYCFEKRRYYYMPQKKFDLEKAIVEAGSFTGFDRQVDPEVLSDRISRWLKSL